MKQSLIIQSGETTWNLEFSETQRVPLLRNESAVALAEPRVALQNALENPIGLNAPLRRALTPDDQVTIILDEQIPHLVDCLVVVIEHLNSAHIPTEAIRVLVPKAGPQHWIDELPEQLEELQILVHNPDDQKGIGYLATTQSGQRVYLNRAIIEADFIIVLGGRRFDAKTGYAGGELAIFPAMANRETLDTLPKVKLVANPADADPKLRTEAAEIAWLLGTPLLIQVIEGPGDSIADFVVGLPPSTSQGCQRQDQLWTGQVTDSADLVIATVPDAPERVQFRDLAQAFHTAAKFCRPGGRVVLWTTAAPILDEVSDQLRRFDDVEVFLKALLRKPQPDSESALLWVYGLKDVSLFIYSAWPDELTEELFATPLAKPSELQRLLDQAPRHLLLPDAHKLMVELLPKGDSR